MCKTLSCLLCGVVDISLNILKNAKKQLTYSVAEHRLTFTYC